jgi:hypothetical protein
MELGTIPQKWRPSMVKVLHKKGDTNDTNKYCRISLEFSPFKVLTGLLMKRLQAITKNVLPD